jgi:hypothetical protein
MGHAYLNTAPIVLDLQELQSTILHMDRNIRRTSVEAIL